MDIKAKEIVMVPVDELKFDPRNFNKHPERQLKQLEKIIRYQGMRRPITISNRTGCVNCGEARAIVAGRIGMTHIPAMFQDYADEAQEIADAVADNQIDKQSEFSMKEFNQVLPDIGPIDLDYFGFKDLKVDPSEITIKEKELDENIHTDKECPSCGYKW